MAITGRLRSPSLQVSTEMNSRLRQTEQVARQLAAEAKVVVCHASARQEGEGRR